MSKNYKKYACSAWPVCGRDEFRKRPADQKRCMNISIAEDGKIVLGVPIFETHTVVTTMSRKDARLLARRLTQALNAK